MMLRENGYFDFYFYCLSEDVRMQSSHLALLVILNIAYLWNGY